MPGRNSVVSPIKPRQFGGSGNDPKRAESFQKNKTTGEKEGIEIFSCVQCGAKTHGWGTVTNIRQSPPGCYQRVCSLNCNNLFYTTMWANVPWVDGKITETF